MQIGSMLWSYNQFISAELNKSIIRAWLTKGCLEESLRADSTLLVLRATVYLYLIVLARAGQAGILLAGSLLCRLGKFYELNLPAVNINSCQGRRPMVSFSVAVCQLPT